MIILNQNNSNPQKPSMRRIADNENSQKLQIYKLDKVRLIKVFHIAEIRNQWVNWDGDTDIVTTHWGVVYFSLDKARDAVERMRTSGSQFQIKELAALLFVNDSVSLLVADSNNSNPFVSITKETLWERVDNLMQISNVFMPQKFMVKFQVDGICELANDCLINETFNIQRSSSGGKRHGLAWSIKTYGFNIEALFNFVNKFNVLLKKRLEHANFPVNHAVGMTTPIGNSLKLDAQEKKSMDLDNLNDNALDSVSSHIETDNGEHATEMTERTKETKARIGQDIFRSKVEIIEPCCRVTKITSSEHLIASHIKPWSQSNDIEKLDGNNGLMLAPHIDHLFDGGYISFSKEGGIMISERLDRCVLEAWSIPHDLNVGVFNEVQEKYLSYHRSNIFKR